jgi:hypothetical protein
MRKVARRQADSVEQAVELNADMLLAQMIGDIANIVTDEYGLPDMEKVATEVLYSPVKKSDTWDGWKGGLRKDLRKLRGDTSEDDTNPSSIILIDGVS